MRILALEPYYGGSHRAFLDGWIARSRHDWTVLTYPDTKWKWRMRHAAEGFARTVAERTRAGQSWDAVFCSDMLGLAEFKGLVSPQVHALPSVAYFHENQLTYPVQHENERDYHFFFSNMMTARAATRVWFNSAFHRDSFLDALGDFLARMPDHQPLQAVEAIRGKSNVRYPGIDPAAATRRGAPDTPHLLWAARWEYDKNPEMLYDALTVLSAGGVAFALSVIGGTGGRQPPPVFGRLRERFRSNIVYWGYQPVRADYLRVLAEADIAVSTSEHEFFGIGMVEAAAAGAYPLMPKRLAYPEVFSADSDTGRGSFFYEGDAATLAERLRQLIAQCAAGTLWEGDPDRARRIVARYGWDRVAPALDGAMEAL